MQLSQAISRSFWHYLAQLIFVSVGMLLFFQLPYFQEVLLSETRYFLMALWIGVALLGWPFYYFSIRSLSVREYRKSHFFLFLDSFLKIWQRQKLSAMQKEILRVKLLGFVVKFFFLPLMLNFCFGHLAALRQLTPQFLWTWQSFNDLFWQVGYHFIFNLIFFIDTLVFAAAYSFEFDFLKNRIRSVDPHFFGWFVVLICYPPFNNLSNEFIPLFQSVSWIENIWILDSFKIGILLVFGIYVWATLALGWRAGNLVNRGIVSRGPYRFVRHPAYAAKNFAWWFEFLPFLTPATFLALLAWNGIYILRGITEERHLSADPDYQKYKKQVRWKFIPGVW